MPPAPGPSPASVLVVDDTPANIVVLRAVLDPIGVRVVEAHSGPEAIQRACHESFAVVLLDVQMPGMDGFEVANRLRKTAAGAELPIIFLTAIHRDEKYARTGYDAGAADYITKPFDPSVLRARVKAFADLFQQRERLRLEEVGERTRERDEALEKLADLLAREHAARLEAESASRMKDEFLAAVSHELRTPLSAILGWSEVARVASSPDADRAIIAIERNARAQMRLIEDLLDIGRIVSGKMQLEISAVNVADAIDGAIAAVLPAANAKQLSIDVAVDEHVGCIAADAERLQQIMWNLLSNAIKFASNGDRIEVRVTHADSKVIIRVRDDGQGIHPDFLPHIFEAFRQADGSTARRHGGLGLGLAIVRHLVHAHGGTITPFSEGPGRGATFTIELPAPPIPKAVRDSARAIRRDAGAKAKPSHTRLDSLRLLVVDDDEDSRELLARMLAEQGAKVSTAQSAEEALRLLDEDIPDVLVSDIGMPHVDGYALIRQIRSRRSGRGRRTPAIALTAYARPEDGERAVHAGFQAHLTKPIDAERLTALVESLAATSRGIGGDRQ